ncbi:MAG: DEAD/DEAH box helicase [Anaerolineae bacterium]
MQFQELNLIDPLLRAVRGEGYEQATPIQAQAIPHVLAGRDLIGCAQTGTGKTAAFALPILQRLIETPQNRKRRWVRALVLSPTRELAAQIGQNFAAYSRYADIKHLVVYGGVSINPQMQALRTTGADVLIATPGRLLDLLRQKAVRLDAVEIFVLDEADRMLDMGFINDVRKVIETLPNARQTLLFSATMPEAIQELADQILDEPMRVEVTPQATTVERIDQSVFFVDKQNKRALLEHLLEDSSIQRALVFTRTKHGANKLAEQLARVDVRTEAIHGNKSQSARERALALFRAGKIRVLVATDIAARGIDVDDVTHVINYDLPNEPESYVHRIGRTARAGASGVAYSFCAAEERKYLRDIEKLIRLRVSVVPEHPFMSAGAASASHAHSQNGKPNGHNRSNSSGQGYSKHRRPNNSQTSSGNARSASNSGGKSHGSGSSNSTTTSSKPNSNRPYNGGKSRGGPRKPNNAPRRETTS